VCAMMLFAHHDYLGYSVTRNGCEGGRESFNFTGTFNPCVIAFVASSATVVSLYFFLIHEMDVCAW